jgi:hypothetical protein
MTEVRVKNTKLLISAVIRNHLNNTPMAGLEDEFIKCEIDPLLMIAIGTAESGLGQAYASWFNEKNHNPFGLSSNGDIISYNTWEEAIQAECKLLTKYIVNHGAKTISQIGFTYAADNNWPANVEGLYVKLLNEAENL